MDLCGRLERHWLGCMASMGGGARVTRFGGAVVVANPQVAGSFLNFATLNDVQPEKLAGVLAFAATLLAAYRRQPALFLAPVAGDMTQLGEQLAALGWRRVVRQSVLTCQLPALERGPDQPRAAGYSAIEVEQIGPEKVAEWGRILEEGYEVSPVAGAEIRAAWTSLMQEPGVGARADYYLARVGNTPAGTGLAWSQGEIAGLYAGAVVPAYRRQGVHRALVHRRLEDAAHQGRQLAVLQTEVGSPVEHLCIDRLGFEKPYERELWLPASGLRQPR